MDQDQEDQGPAPLSATEAVERHGCPSEFLGPLPRGGGPGCERFRAMRDRWRAYDDQRRDIASAVAAEDGRFDDVNDALAACEREIGGWEARAAGWGDPSAEGRLTALRARRVYLLSLRDRQPPQP